MDRSPTRENKDHKQSEIHLINQSMYSQAQELTLNSERQFLVGQKAKGLSPRGIFEELQQVKAERDFYYDKLLRVRAKVKVAGDTNEKVENFKT